MSELAVLESSELVVTIERARLALNDGDVQAALLLSSGAYDKAKAAGAYASRVKASRSLVDKARMMQADALKIEALAYCAMADTVDEAQAKGAISRGGRPETVQGKDRFSLEEVGIDKRRLHEARQLRNAERKEPGFVERIVEARLEEGLEPSRASLKAAASGADVGTKRASKEERGVELYQTPPQAMRTLLALESFAINVLEPSVGKGAILRPMEEAGYNVAISDLVDRGVATKDGECQAVGDFLKQRSWSDDWDIVTNPPFGIANAYAAHALREFRPGKMALLLNFNFCAGFDDPDRCFVMDENPPSRIYVFTRRLPMMHRDGWQGNEADSRMNCAWFVWERNVDGSYGRGYPQIIRVDWEAFKDAPPLSPGMGGNIAPVGFRVVDDELSRETPRKTLDERVSEVMEAAIEWMRWNRDKPGLIDARALRLNLGIRSTTADAIIERLAADGRIERVDDGWSWAGDVAGKAVSA